MSVETTKKNNDALENIKQIEKYGEEVLKPILSKIADAKGSVKSIYDAAKKKHDILRDRESMPVAEAQPTQVANAEAPLSDSKEPIQPTQENNKETIVPIVTAETPKAETPKNATTNVETTPAISEVKQESTQKTTLVVENPAEARTQYLGSERRPYDPNRQPYNGGERKPYDPNNRPPYDPNRQPYNGGERKPYDPNNRPPYDPNRQSRPYDPNNRPPYDPNRQSRPYDPNNRPPYDPNRQSRPYDPNNRPPYDPNRPQRPYDPNNRPPYDPNRPQRPYDPNNRPPYNGGDRKPAGGGFRSNVPEFVPPIVAKDTKAIDKKKLETKKFEDNRTAKKVKSRGVEYANGDYEGEDTIHFKARRGGKRQAFIEPLNIKIEHAIVNAENVQIKNLSEKIGKTGTEIIRTLFMLGIIKTINESIDFATAQLVSDNFGITLELKRDQTFEEKLEDSLITDEIESDIQEKRPPVVAIMGHVDHGKTSLLDFIRRASVASGEAGGITQHIGAYTITIDGNPITFLDTPGHEAFTSLRARGAQVTDIAIIVVAAEDGIMPQTIEAIKHAKAAKVDIIIAINKMDKFGATTDKVYQQLTQYELLPEEWGGDTIVVPLSAKTGMNVNKLLESILLIAEVKDYKANPICMARGTVIEAKLDSAKGPVATVLVQQGTLKVSDYIVAGKVIGKVRALIDDKGRMIKSAGPSIPVSVLGFSDIPTAGDIFNVVRDEKLAKQVAEERKLKDNNVSGVSGMTKIDDFFKTIQDGQIKDLNVILKTDVHGTFEALKQELLKICNEEVRVNIIHGAVGAINESDIMLAKTSGAIVIGFNVRPDTKAKAEADRSAVDVRTYRIIYDVINDIQKEFKGMLVPKFKEIIVGHAQVRAIFKVTGAGTIAGCMVTDGKISRNNKLRLMRDNVAVIESSISSLKRMKDDVKDVATGYECGIGLRDYNDFKEGDILECFIMEELAR